MTMVFWITWSLVVLWPSVVVAGACSEFPWPYPQEMVMPEMVKEGQAAMQEGSLLKAQELFSTYVKGQEEGLYAEGARWVLASLPDHSDEFGKEFLKRIQRLQVMKANKPDSVYAPWAICSMGQLYWDAGWHSEASTLFEEFLRTYPEHSMAGGVMVEAGTGYLENHQFLEAALIFRRVVEEPKWEAHRLKGALGLADATAMSNAWSQAYYWYRVVEAEAPELIRQSGRSSYYYGVTELTVGESANVLPRFLVPINLHPHGDEAGQALIRISEKLLEEGHEFMALWFADQARQRYANREPGRRGQIALLRWVVSFLSQEHSKAEWEKVYQRLNGLEIYLSVSWDNVLETSRVLSFAPEPDVADESVAWMGRGYHILGDIPAAIQSFAHLVIVTTSERRRQEGQRWLVEILNQQIQSFFDQKAWVKLLKFHEEHKQAFDLIPIERERVMMVAQAYQRVNLPSKALRWYDQLLKEYPNTPFREEILAEKVFLAEEQGENQLVREVGEGYLREFPNGQWRTAVATVLGMELLASEQYTKAIQRLSDAVQWTDDVGIQRYVRRNRARAYQAAGNRGQALQDLRYVASSDSVEIPDVLRLGDFLFDQGDFAEAEPLYDHVLSSDAPVELKAWAKYRWGLSLEYQGKTGDAQKLLAEVQQLETRSPEFENTIRAAASAVLEEFSLKGKRSIRKTNESS